MQAPCYIYRRQNYKHNSNFITKTFANLIEPKMWPLCMARNGGPSPVGLGPQLAPNMSPTTVGYTGPPLSPPSQSRLTEGKDIKGTKEKTKERYKLGRAWPVLFTILPCDLLSFPDLVHSSPGRLCRRPTPYPRALQQLYHCPNSVVLPEPPQRWRPRVLPPTILSHSPPQFSDLRGPCLALRKQMVP